MKNWKGNLHQDTYIYSMWYRFFFFILSQRQSKYFNIFFYFPYKTYPDTCGIYTEHIKFLLQFKTFLNFYFNTNKVPFLFNNFFLSYIKFFFVFLLSEKICVEQFIYYNESVYLYLLLLFLYPASDHVESCIDTRFD